MEADSNRWKEGRKSGQFWEEEGNPDMWGHGVSEGSREGRRARGNWAGGHGSAQERAGAGGRSGPRAGGRPRRAGGLLQGWAETEKGNKNPFLFPFPIIQSIFQIDFEFLFCIFKKVHTIQNIMQQHECSIMFLPLYLISN
jgi:hypothetical protein